ncbi:MAG: DNA alkylation repair protein [Methanotrichaceae archaeon]|nr:DNA alkylation repair protein [Methanotrichaceae archaeon]
MKTDIVSAIREDLKQNIDEKTKNSAHLFFREEVKFYGVKTSIVRNIAKKYFKEINDKDKKEIFHLCEKLLVSDYSEEAFIAFDWAYTLKKEYEPADFYIFENWIQNYVNNWAKCDTFCNHTLGSYIERYPDYLERIKDWARSKNRWFRRASAVTLIIPARKGKFLNDILDISDILLKDKDDLVQKGYGWMLKEASKRHQEEIFDYIMKNKIDMPRTALRYAIEKMPENMRIKAMEK